MHGDEEEIALKEPTVTQPAPHDWLRDFLSPDSTLHSSRKARPDGRDICLRRVRFWWKQVDRLRKFYITHMVKYRQSLSYHSADHLPPGLKETYTIACYADCRWSVGELVSPLLNSSEEGEVSAERFYHAVLARTLDTKALQGLAIFAEIEDSEIGGHTYDQFIKMWSENSDRTLQESVEVLEIFDYTSNFLLLKIFDCPGEHLDWVDDRQKSDLMDDGETFLGNWMDFHTRLQSFLTPLDIFSLFEKNTGEETKCFRDLVTNYLLKLLLINAVDSYQTVPGMAQVEQDLARKLGDIRPGTWEFFGTITGAPQLEGWLLLILLRTSTSTK
ncbi:hypothetical protein N7481_001527 [Penicillium waksmanii]|uniref:uncharacterized protein n=1 Tax=Penicillium waksmanii TaxID=69791 RepID=UPI0025486DF2|nr:uncharacterized protein N7481_001527 [Penicillium waksmanii]KAJ6001118.1 hypothetical protein N7481_001527 [Penicillium waksmanii]